MGFKLYLKKEIQGCIITTFYSPKDPNYDFESKIYKRRIEFYYLLTKRNLYIYPGKTTKADTFRIGSIGDLNIEDMKLLINGIKEAMKEMNVSVPIKY